MGQSYEQMVEVLTNTFQNFVERNDRQYWYFRLTYSGDVFSEEFARAIVTSCSKFPEVRFWMYTRSFDYVKTLVKAPNLAVYLSIDPVNKSTGLQVFEQLKHQYNNVALAHLGEPTDLPEYRFVGCPETFGKVVNTVQRGACAACRLCFTYRNNIRLRNIKFKIH